MGFEVGLEIFLFENYNSVNDLQKLCTAWSNSVSKRNGAG
jgi:hypothetical protein